MTDQPKSLLRFLTCGSVDDGKSTLIGRLLYDAGCVYDDHSAALAADSKTVGTRGGELDFALLVDGLSAEREQGITIDVAYRYFETAQRKFIVADAPGHEQYTRNMVTGASTADLAILLIDARKGVLAQTRRHALLVHLLGVRHVVLAVNKMDLVQWDETVFNNVSQSFSEVAQRIGLAAPVAIPLAAPQGDNVVKRSTHAPWYAGPTLLDYLNRVEVETDSALAQPLRLPVQTVLRPHLDFRGFAGMVAAGEVRPGQEVRLAPSGARTRIARLVDTDQDLQVGVAGQSVTVTFADDVDCARGEVICAASDPCEAADQFDAHLVWMSDAPLLPGRPYGFKLGAQKVSAQVTDIRHKLNVNSMERWAAKTLELNEIGLVSLALDRPIAFAPYEQNKDLGGFILIDRIAQTTVAAGMIRFALRRAHNIHWQALDISREKRAAAMGQRPAVIWLTGLSGAGKSTIANILEKKLFAEGKKTLILDGDNIRHGLNKDLGFSDADRVENIRRVAEVARLMTDAGLIVIVSFISPFRSERDLARRLMAEGEFFEVFIDTPLEAAERRDVKGLYSKARSGQLKHFTGVSSPYEPPEAPDLRIETERLAPDQAADLILDMLANARQAGEA